MKLSLPEGAGFHLGNVTRIDVIQVLVPWIAAGLEARVPREVSRHISALPGKLLPPADALQGSLKKKMFKVSCRCFFGRGDVETLENYILGL